jgi:hypothetical protein
MRDAKMIQADLDAAQADLEKSVNELKHIIEHKLEGPKHIIEVVEKPVSFVKEHAVLIGVALTFGLGILVGRAVFDRD